jgi:hypothetical protein
MQSGTDPNGHRCGSGVAPSREVPVKKGRVGTIPNGVAVVICAALLLAQPATAAAGGAAKLHRPLDLPELEAGEPCPVSPVDDRLDWERIGIFGGSGTGPGPVYPGIGETDPRGHIITRRDSSDDPWFGTKVFWYVKPGYRGPALLRGVRLDGPGSIRFHQALRPGRRTRDLRINRFDEEFDRQWRPPGARGRPSRVYVRSPGCYGVQIDGTRFSRTVVFTASTEA